jgi:hypothetical protein
MRLEGSNQFMVKLRSFAAHWKLLIIPVVVVAVGLAIALPISMASARGTAGSILTRSDRAEHAHATTRPGAGCMVRYTATNWPGALTAKVTISNRGSTSINGWSLTFRFPGDEAVSGAWNATFTQTGTEVSARNMNYDGTIQPGASQSLGFLGAWTSDDAAPAAFRVNHAACTAHA